MSDVAPEPDPALADLSDQEQVELVEQTDNRLSDDDAGVEQPPQDPNWRPEDDA